MARLFGLILCLALVWVIAFTIIGRAVDHEIEQRVLVPQNGALWDCERIVSDGRAAYTNCHIVP